MENELHQLKDNNYKTLDFIAVDFETATTKGRHPCQIGITVVKDGNIIQELSRFIQPPNNRYDKICSEVHHITEEHTKNAPAFPAVWEEIKPLFDNAFIVAHNASFDISILRSALDFYNISYPNILGYACTCDIFHRLRLNEACSLYDIELNNHHDASCDSTACAMLYINHVKEIPLLHPVEDILESKKKRLPKSDCRMKKYNTHIQIKGDVLIKDLSHADPSNPLYDKKVVITGAFAIDRIELAQLLKTMGADVNCSISRKTDYVLIGTEPGSSKMKKLDELVADGYNIGKLFQEDLDEIMKGNWTNYKK